MMDDQLASSLPGEFPGQPTIQDQLDAEFHANWAHDLDDFTHEEVHQELSSPTDTQDPLNDDYLIDTDPQLSAPLEADVEQVNGNLDHLFLRDDTEHISLSDHRYPSQPHQHSPTQDRTSDDSNPPQDGSTGPYDGYQYIGHPSPDRNLSPSPPVADPVPPVRHRPSYRDRGSASDHHEKRGDARQNRGHRSARIDIPHRRPSMREGGPPRYRGDGHGDSDWSDRSRRAQEEYVRRPSWDEAGSPQIQVYAANQPPPAAPPAAPAVNLGETMQMMMMSQMMQQQQQAQQMQAVQMASMMGQKAKSSGERCGRDSACGRRKESMLVNIQSGAKKRRIVRRKVDPKPVMVRKVQPAPVRLPVLPPPSRILGDEESGGFENWQEATIILCLMIVGLIYLVSSRASAADPPAKTEKKSSSAAAYLNGPP